MRLVFSAAIWLLLLSSATLAQQLTPPIVEGAFPGPPALAGSKIPPTAGSIPPASDPSPNAYVGAIAPVLGAVSGRPSANLYGGLGKYRDFTCPQLTEEARKVSLRIVGSPADKVAKRSDESRANAEGIVLSWPETLDAKLTAEEAAHIRQEMAAIEEATIQAQCSIQFRR
jgi:hypothetical protein